MASGEWWDAPLRSFHTEHLIISKQSGHMASGEWWVAWQEQCSKRTFNDVEHVKGRVATHGWMMKQLRQCLHIKHLMTEQVKERMATWGWLMDNYNNVHTEHLMTEQVEGAWQNRIGWWNSWGNDPTKQLITLNKWRTHGNTGMVDETAEQCSNKAINNSGKVDTWLEKRL